MEFASYQQAKIAINKFDGAMTKGQTISIRLLPPHQPRPAKGAGGGATGAQSGGSLLSRISGGGAQKQAPSAPRGGGGAGVARGRGSTRGRGAGAGGTGGRAGGGRKAPADAGSLDKELDSFMAGSGDVAME
ncbi:hypothetical protein EHS25_009781 [Saitozyma podzolica]|uniref:Chromatin target of PRMT1 protein C-terminal domain-containing protein n=1 Tax=Saitozyma podzolica TaxID=1890683 RepID=A0A427YK61_9TREE|nr:hypothetical protein EHS25_009781 [Saitozyma podzolica]